MKSVTPSPEIHDSPAKAKPLRKPTQARGQQRVELILDACVRLLLADGEAALTMHGIAREAQTSIGSLYHFFPDKKSVLEALRERHYSAMQTLTERVEEITDEQWRGFTVEEVVQHLMRPFLEYLAKNLAFLYLIHSRERGEPRAYERSLHDVLFQVISLRTPGATQTQRHSYTATLYSLPVGMLTELLLDYEHALYEPILSEEMPRAMTAYLRAVEDQHRL